MPDKDIKELLRKYLNGSATPDERKLVDDWYDSLSGGDKIRVSDDERSHLRSTYWQSIQKEMRTYREERSMWPMLSLAAAVSILICLVIFFAPSLHSFDGDSSLAHSEGDYEIIENQSDAEKLIMLSDSSVITLSPGSEIRVSPTFGERDRQVQLSGGAFFDIYRDESKPFFVVANEIVTRVLGTSFSVKAFPNDSDITVAVASGKVSVYAHAIDDILVPEKETVVLTPNQQAIYNKDEGKVSRLLVKEPQIIIPKEEAEKIRFEGIAVSEIFKTLEKMYGVEIEFDEKAFSNCSMTTSVSGKDLYERIDVICEITGTTYTVEDTRIRISGPGCN
jgi:hypothetical protein